jgi:hypothetical protein
MAGTSPAMTERAAAVLYPAGVVAYAAARHSPYDRASLAAAEATGDDCNHDGHQISIYTCSIYIP